MTLAAMPELLTTQRAIGAFNFNQLEVAEAIVQGAETAGCGVVLQLSENAVKFHGSLHPIASAARAVAELSSAPVVLHLDHATDEALVSAAIAEGCTSVMFDGAHLSDAENIERTRAVVDDAHTHGVWVEAELGEIGGKGAHAPGVRTAVSDAVPFVQETGVDALAVAVGSEHAMRERSASLDLDLIRALATALPVPLVLHGSSGVPEEVLKRAIVAGMRKINIGTLLSERLTASIRRSLAEDPMMADPRKYLAPARDAVAAEVAHSLSRISGEAL